MHLHVQVHVLPNCPLILLNQIIFSVCVYLHVQFQTVHTFLLLYSTVCLNKMNTVFENNDDQETILLLSSLILKNMYMYMYIILYRYRLPIEYTAMLMSPLLSPMEITI